MAYEILNEMRYANEILQALGRSSDTYSDLENKVLANNGRKTERVRGNFYNDVQILRKIGLVCIDKLTRPGMPLRLTPIGRQFSVQNNRVVIPP